MQKLNAHGKLVLGLVLGLTAALPLACGSDDSNGVPSEEGGASGKGGAASAGKGGTTAAAGKGGTTAAAGKAGAPEGGGTPAGGGATEAGAPGEMGGEGGAPTTEPTAGAGGQDEAMGGAGGDAGDPAFDANVEATCTTEGSLNCSTNGAASDKQDCIDLFAFVASDYSACLSVEKAFVACLANKPATDFECSEDTPPMPLSKGTTCTTEAGDFNDCLAAP